MDMVIRPVTTVVVETGAGLPDADSYLSVQEAIQYHTARGNLAWLRLTTLEARDIALRLATDYLRQEYSGLWKGCKTHAHQRLDWPREGVCVDGFDVPADSVPEAVRHGCAELALRVLQGPLSPDLKPQPIRKTAGPITVEYDPGGRQSPHYSAVDGLLRPYLQASNGLIRMERA